MQDCDHNNQEDNPVGSLQREARWRPQPTPWKGQPTQVASEAASHRLLGEYLYTAHAHYGQAIAEFCEQAVHMRQFVGRGEPWDMANGI